MDVINVRYYLCLIDFWTSGHEADAKHWCPVMLLSNFTYSHNDGSATNCGPSNSDLAVCPSWTTMTFNYASCSTVQGFSGRCLFLNKSSLILNTECIIISWIWDVFLNKKRSVRIYMFNKLSLNDSVYVSMKNSGFFLF